MRDSIGIIGGTMRKHRARNKTCAGLRIYIATRNNCGCGSLSAAEERTPVANTLIHESRRLQFPLDTLVDALIELEDKQGHWPAKATVVGASIEDLGAGNALLILSLHQSENGQVKELRYTSPMIAAAIVNYCVTMRVPMPRNSSKSIQILADGVALVLENTVILQSRHEELSTLPAGSVQIVRSRENRRVKGPRPARPQMRRRRRRTPRVRGPRLRRRLRPRREARAQRHRRQEAGGNSARRPDAA